MLTYKEIYENACATVKNLLDTQTDILEFMFEDIKQIPDDEVIQIKAGELKSFIDTYMTLIHYINQDMDKVKDYLTRRKLI